MLKRTLAMVLTVIMVLSLLPVGVLADDAPWHSNQEQTLKFDMTNADGEEEEKKIFYKLWGYNSPAGGNLVYDSQNRIYWAKFEYDGEPLSAKKYNEQSEYADLIYNFDNGVDFVTGHSEGVWTYYDDSKVLEEGKAINAGQYYYKLKVQGTNSDPNLKVEITPRDISDADADVIKTPDKPETFENEEIILSENKYKYDGTTRNITQENFKVSVSVNGGNKILVLDKSDYTFDTTAIDENKELLYTYSAKDVGDYDIKVIAKDGTNYTGSKVGQWHIIRGDLERADYEFTEEFKIAKDFSTKYTDPDDVNAKFYYDGSPLSTYAKGDTVDANGIMLPAFVTTRNQLTRSGSGEVTMHYRANGDSNGAWIEGLPTDVGYYDIAFTVGEGENYNAHTDKIPYGVIYIDTARYDDNVDGRKVIKVYGEEFNVKTATEEVSGSLSTTSPEYGTDVNWTWKKQSDNDAIVIDDNGNVKKSPVGTYTVVGSYATDNTHGQVEVTIEITKRPVAVSGSYTYTKEYDGNTELPDAVDTLALEAENKIEKSGILTSDIPEGKTPADIEAFATLGKILNDAEYTEYTDYNVNYMTKSTDVVPVDTFNLVFTLNDDFSNNYTLSNDLTGTATITPKQITANVNATSVYGEDTINPGTPTYTDKGGNAFTLPNDDVLNLDFEPADGKGDISTWDVGDYEIGEDKDVIGSCNNPNYIVDVIGTLKIGKDTTHAAFNESTNWEVTYTDTSRQVIALNKFGTLEAEITNNVKVLSSSEYGEIVDSNSVEYKDGNFYFKLYDLSGYKYDQVKEKRATLVFEAKNKNYENPTYFTIYVSLTDKINTADNKGKSLDGTYNGLTHKGYEEAPTFKGYKFDDLTITYEGITYNKDENGNNKYGPTKELPWQAGEYKVTFTIPTNLVYRGEETLNFKINPKPVNVYPSLTINDEEIFNVEDIDLIFETLVEGDPEPAIENDKKLEVKVVKKGTDEEVPTDEPLPIGVYDIKWINKKDITYDDENYSYTNKDNGVLTVTRAPNRFRDYDWSRELRNLYNQTFIITAFENEGGTISNPGDTIVKFNKSVTYEITPADGYVINYVLVDGQSVGAVKKYTFKNVQDHHTIVPVFKEAPWVSPYSDVASADWFYEDVAYVNKNGFMTSTDTAGTKFSPNSELNRATVVTVLWRMQGSPIVTEIEDFIDVPSGEWYTEATRWAAANGIVKGFEDYSFHPTEAVTHEQLCAILRRYADYLGIEDSMLVTVLPQYDYSTWAENDVIWASMNGLLNGIPGMLDLTEAGTRAEFAAFLRRLADIID